jgi:YgiT-type zinc finger domain-containing protein
MKCAACHNRMTRKRGEIDLRIKGKLYLVRNVVFEECPACGEKVLSPEVARVLFDRISNNEFVEESVKIPVLDGTYG